jgi:hypothetical protein
MSCAAPVVDSGWLTADPFGKFIRAVWVADTGLLGHFDLEVFASSGPPEVGELLLHKHISRYDKQYLFNCSAYSPGDYLYFRLRSCCLDCSLSEFVVGYAVVGSYSDWGTSVVDFVEDFEGDSWDYWPVDFIEDFEDPSWITDWINSVVDIVEDFESETWGVVWVVSIDDLVEDFESNSFVGDWGLDTTVDFFEDFESW